MKFSMSFIPVAAVIACIHTTYPDGSPCWPRGAEQKTRTLLVQDASVLIFRWYQLSRG